jgi:uncharacterized protein YwgA
MSETKKMMDLDGLKLLLALLYDPDSTGRTEIRGFTRLEKLIFLIQEEGLHKRFYQYEAYDYGPWSREIHDDVELLGLRGIIVTRREPLKVPVEAADTDECLSQESEEIDEIKTKFVEVYGLTKPGEKAASSIWRSLTEEERRGIETIKKNFNQKSLMELIRYVYTKYPDYAEKSKIKNQIFSFAGSYASRPNLESPQRDQD